MYIIKIDSSGHRVLSPHFFTPLNCSYIVSSQPLLPLALVPIRLEELGSFGNLRVHGLLGRIRVSHRYERSER